MAKLAYIILGFLGVCSGICVISTKNPVHSVLYLILVFVNVMGMVMILGLDFIGLIILLVYVGAVAVLFLFIVMMLNVKVVELAELRIRYMPLGLSIIFVLLVEIFVLYEDRGSVVLSNEEELPLSSIANLREVESNIEVLGNLLYGYYLYYFMVAGLILLLAMVGAICITYMQDTKIKKQVVYKQLIRDYRTTVRYKRSI